MSLVMKHIKTGTKTANVNSFVIWIISYFYWYVSEFFQK